MVFGVQGQIINIFIYVVMVAFNPFWEPEKVNPCLFCFQFHLSYTDKERYENEERPEVQKQILVDMAKKLPVYTRTGSGGQFIISVGRDS